LMIFHKAQTLNVARITGYTSSRLRRAHLSQRVSVAFLSGASAEEIPSIPARVGRSATPQRRVQLQKQAIVVEGLSDKRAVQLAVPDAVFVLGSSKWIEGKNSARILESLRHGLPQFERIVVLMDPDVAGRQGRNALEAEFPGQFWHAFLPVQLATSVKASRWHGVGNVGVEHASPVSIRQSLDTCRQTSPERKHFSKEQLLNLGLTSTFTNTTVQTKRRREAVCDFLGLGNCDGKQLLKQLNLYNFTDDDLREALKGFEEGETLHS